MTQQMELAGDQSHPRVDRRCRHCRLHLHVADDDPEPEDDVLLAAAVVVDC